MTDLAVIGGTGLTELPELVIERREVVATPWGAPSGPLTHGRLHGRAVVFLARHGYGHNIPPHRVNYRANLWALRAAGAPRLLAVAAVGGIRADMRSGRIAFPDQVIDYTSGRAHTYFEDDLDHVTHVDFTQPYDEGFRAALIAAARQAGLDAVEDGTYGAAQGVANAAIGTETEIPLFLEAYLDDLDGSETLFIQLSGVTGAAYFVDESARKAVALLKEIAPRTRTVAVFARPENEGYPHLVRVLNAAASALKVEFRFAEVRTAGDFEHAFATILRLRADALLMTPEPLIISQRFAIGRFGAENMLPLAIVFNKSLLDAGALLTYGPASDVYPPLVARYVDRIRLLHLPLVIGPRLGMAPPSKLRGLRIGPR